MPIFDKVFGLQPWGWTEDCPYWKINITELHTYNTFYIYLFIYGDNTKLSVVYCTE